MSSSSFHFSMSTIQLVSKERDGTSLSYQYIPTCPGIFSAPKRFSQIILPGDAKVTML